MYNILEVFVEGDHCSKMTIRDACNRLLPIHILAEHNINSIKCQLRAYNQQLIGKIQNVAKCHEYLTQLKLSDSIDYNNEYFRILSCEMA